MNFFKIIEQLAEVDSDALGRFDSRRAVFNSLGSMAKRTAFASAPLMLAGMFQKAYAGGQGTQDAKDVIQYALTLEKFELDFYNKMLASNQFPNAAARTSITKIRDNEQLHVKTLTAVVGALGGSVGNVGFRADKFPADYATQLVVAQALEDTGVRAYKGRAGELLGLADVTVTGVGPVNLLTAALQIHSVEARHAAHIRGLRQQTGWIKAADSNLPAPLGPIYTGATREDNITQSMVNLTNGLGTTYSADDVAAAFDEILTPAEVLDASRAGSLIQM